MEDKIDALTLRLNRLEKQNRILLRVCAGLMVVPLLAIAGWTAARPNLIEAKKIRAESIELITKPGYRFELRGDTAIPKGSRVAGHPGATSLGPSLNMTGLGGTSVNLNGWGASVSSKDSKKIISLSATDQGGILTVFDAIRQEKEGTISLGLHRVSLGQFGERAGMILKNEKDQTLEFVQPGR